MKVTAESLDTYLMTEPEGLSNHREHLDVIIMKVSKGGTRT